jgi:5-methylcytosine-specific restriction endonuclease McrA
MLSKPLYKKYDPGTYLTRDLYRTVFETKDLRPVWAWKNAQKWLVDYDQFLAKCGEACACCGSPLDYGLGKNNTSKLDVNTPSTDHIVPQSLDESKKNDINNLWIICNRCNLLKNNSTPEDIYRYRRILETLEQIDKSAI